MTTITRFAPSPTGLLHIGHVYSAQFAKAEARRLDGRFLLRIENIDTGRCRPEFETAIAEDLAWLGLKWEKPVRRQSEHMGDYRRALNELERLGLLYPCFCTRKEIIAETEAAGHAPHDLPPGQAGPLYPGTCRDLDAGERDRRIAADDPFSLRLHMARASAQAGHLCWRDLTRGDIEAEPEIFGDVVLARKDTPTSYHLAVTIDDHLQNVSVVTRGEDLLAATHVHRLLQELLGLDVPDYRHHRLVTNEDGRRLAKRDRAVTIAGLREAGKTPTEVLANAGWEDDF
ncbi:MAG: tRNA glutamyl-Q(34) synthetase GluQRS [Pseudomonadota bacterium]|nr:tRNA glutamyl-Q(34) synthetase GluQRS [Pseudomonadota bacterium]